MNNGFIVGMIGFLFFFLLSRMISTRAIKGLDPEIRHKIYDEFIQRNNMRTIVMIVFYMCYFASISIFRNVSLTLSICFIALYFVYAIVNLLSTNKKLHAIGAPEDYVHSIVVSWALYLGG